MVTLVLGLALAGTASAAPRYDRVVLSGPGAAVSWPLIHMVETGALKDLVGKLEFRHWKNVDQMRVLLARQQIDFTATPVNLPAILANRGRPVRLLNVSVWGILWFVSRDPAIKTLDDLAGRTLLTTFRRDLPAILLNRLTDGRGLTGDRAIEVRYTRSSQDAIALMLTGEADNALLVEPSVSLLLAQNARRSDVPLHRVASLEQAWRETFPANPDVPQAGIMVSARLADDRELSRALNRAYAEAARWCKANPPQCAAEVHKYLPFMPADAIEASIAVTRLDSRSASGARPALESLYRLILEHNPQAVGGRLPDPDFYAQ